MHFNIKKNLKSNRYRTATPSYKCCLPVIEDPIKELIFKVLSPANGSISEAYHIDKK
jgi:hypothetical protein